MSRPRSRAAGALLTLAAAACSGGSTGPPITGNPPPPRPLLSPTYRPSGHMAAGDVFVHLFEWKWTDIAPECETVLGPAGFAAVQVSPPEEHSITPNHDWSERYQPVRYNIARSRSGTQAEFTDMVSRCAAVGVGDKFRQIGGQHISQLNPNGSPGNQFSPTAWGLMPPDKAVVFLQNHDTQHQCGISYRDGNVFRVANVWVLAQPYGYPSILSSYAFNCPAENSMGPPSDANGWTVAVNCASSLETATDGEWVCEHRDPYLRGMVAFRKLVAGSDVNDWWDDGANAIAFSRGNRGFVAISREGVPVDTTITTGMPPGTYCDILTGGLVMGSCVGAALVVDSSNAVHVHLASNTAVAIDAATKLP